MNISDYPEMPLLTDDSDEIRIVINGEYYIWRDGKWLADIGKPLSEDRQH